jgi:hypothetical protein
MLALRAVAGTSPAVAQTFPAVLQSLAGVRKSVGLDGPQQLLDLTAPPAELKNAAEGIAEAATSTIAAAKSRLLSSISPAVPTTAIVEVHGLAPPQVEAEIAAVPEPQRTIAAMLPLSDLPAGWSPGKSGTKYIESFNADNLYEKIDGRAESFLQYGVKGMAYTYYHPTGDPSNELQLYVFEMADSLKALGKYGSEKPDEAKVIPLGDEGYTAAGSTLFYAGKYYTQIVSTQDDPKFASFALVLAKRVAAKQKPAGGPAAAATPIAASRPAGASASVPTGESTTTAAVEPEAVNPTAEVTPATYFTFLPPADKQGDNKYVAQDVFGYSFLSDVFMADYKKGDVTWQGFLRPYRDDHEAGEVLKKYVASVKQDGAEVKILTSEGADEMIVSSSIGLFDVIFRKGNTLAGANGATSLDPAESFARSLAKTLPAKIQAISSAK